MDGEIPVFGDVEVIEREVVDSEDNCESNETFDTVEVSEVNEESRDLSKEDEEKNRVDWAYSVLDWLRIAAKAKRWDAIEQYAEEILTAFLVLVKEEHRGIVMETIRCVVSSARGD